MEDYDYIRKWGRHVGSQPWYIDAEVRLAQREHAPANATYKSHDGEWHTTDDVTNPETRIALGLD